MEDAGCKKEEQKRRAMEGIIVRIKKEVGIKKEEQSKER